MWSQPGPGKQPNLTFLGDQTEVPQILISSPFANKIQSLGFRTGQKMWSTGFTENVPYATLPLDEAVIVQGDQGTIWALKNDSGDSLWQVRTKEPLDYPISPPRFRNGSVFTLSRRGVLRKLDKLGRVVATTRLPNSWGRRVARTVPLRSSQQKLAFLDQSGRFTNLDPGNFELTEQRLWPSGEGEAERAYGKSREVLAGALTETGDGVWALELPGQIQGVSLGNGETVWYQRLLNSGDFWSSEGRLLGVPTPVEWEGEACLLLVLRKSLFVFKGSTGLRKLSFELPSEAVAPPAYDRKTETWWLLCHQHFVKFPRAGKPITLPHALGNKPYTLTILDSFAVVGAVDGRLFGIALPK